MMWSITVNEEGEKAKEVWPRHKAADVPHPFHTVSATEHRLYVNRSGRNLVNKKIIIDVRYNVS